MEKRHDKLRLIESHDLDNIKDAQLKELIRITDDLMKMLITLSSALLGVGFIFVNFVSTAWIRLLIILLFFLSLIISFLGVLPINVRYDVENTGENRQQEIRSFKRKRRHLWLSAIILAAGFICAIVDIFMDLILELK